MIRTHPCLPWLAIRAFLVRGTRHGRIQTVKMPMQRTVIAGDHLSLAQGGATATEAEEGVVLLIPQFQVVRNLVIARPCSGWEISTRPEARGHSCLAAGYLLGNLDIVQLLVLTFLPGRDTFEVVPHFCRKMKCTRVAEFHVLLQLGPDSWGTFFWLNVGVKLCTTRAIPVFRQVVGLSARVDRGVTACEMEASRASIAQDQTATSAARSAHVGLRLEPDVSLYRT